MRQGHTWRNFTQVVIKPPLHAASKPQMNTKWNPPPPLLYQLNVNGALNKAHKLAGIGAIIWNEAGELIGALSKREPVDSLALGVVIGLSGSCCDLDLVDCGLRFFVVVDGCDLLWVGGCWRIRLLWVAGVGCDDWFVGFLLRFGFG
jgi:hypothetical protein